MGHFDSSVRVLVCGTCGAALPPAPVNGGQVTCEFCRSTTIVGARDDRRLSDGGPVDEGARINSLWGQLKEGMRVHDELPKMMEAGSLPERNVEFARSHWDSTRALMAVDPAAAGDDLMWLTSALAGYYATHDRARVRALWESALESSRDPRHRQYVRGAMCRLAVNDGDMAAAQGWLAPCNPQAPDLMSDSTYRLSYSFIATASADYNGVLQALSPDPAGLPFFFTYRVLCGVVRANAIEKLGDVNTATAQLKAFIAADPSLTPHLPNMVRSNPALALCPQSIPAALR